MLEGSNTLGFILGSENIIIWTKLFTGTVPVIKNYVTGTVPANRSYITGTVKKRLRSKNNVHSHRP